MKSFKQYIYEDIEVISGHPRTTKADMKSAQKDFEDDAEHRKNLGKIHNDYSLHRSGRNFWITHDPSKKVVGHIDAEPFSGTDKKSIAIAQLNIDKDHTKKKIGSSLAAAAYRHLHNMGHTIYSGDQQSIGAIEVWKELMHHPATRNYVYAIHNPYGAKGTELGLAHKLSSGDIWTSGSGEARRAASRKGIKMHKYGTEKAERAYDVDLVLRAKKKT